MFTNTCKIYTHNYTKETLQNIVLRVYFVRLKFRSRALFCKFVGSIFARHGWNIDCSYYLNGISFAKYPSLASGERKDQNFSCMKKYSLYGIRYTCTKQTCKAIYSGCLVRPAYSYSYLSNSP